MGGKAGTSTSSVVIPPEVLARYAQVNTQAENIAGVNSATGQSNTPFMQYNSNPNAFVAPLTPTQQAGVAGTNAYAGAAQPFYNLASGMTAGASGPAGLGALNTSQYMSPYMDSVIQSMTQAQGVQNARQRSGLQGDAIRAGAFGGDRAGIAQGNLAYQQNLADQQSLAGALQKGYAQAQGVAQQQQGAQLGAQQADLTRLMAGGQQIGNIGSATQTAGLAGAGAQLAAGTPEQQTQQAGLTALYNQFLQERAYPFQTTQFLANIAEGTGALSGSTTQTTQNQGGLFSDERLKTNIRPVGKTFDGQPIYSYRYKDEDHGPTRMGLLAQDVEETHPNAVGLSGGYKTVDYDRATDDAARLAAEGGAVRPEHEGQGFASGGLTGAENHERLVRARRQWESMWDKNGRPMTGLPGGHGLNIPALAAQLGLTKGTETPATYSEMAEAPEKAEGGQVTYDPQSLQSYIERFMGRAPASAGANPPGLGIPTQGGVRRHLAVAAAPPEQKGGAKDAKEAMDGAESLGKLYQTGKAGVKEVEGWFEDTPEEKAEKLAKEGFADAGVDNADHPDFSSADLGSYGSWGGKRGGRVHRETGGFTGGAEYASDPGYMGGVQLGDAGGGGGAGIQRKGPEKAVFTPDKKRDPIKGALGGAAAGFTVGGPWGAAAGAVLGAVSEMERGGRVARGLGGANTAKDPMKEIGKPSNPLLAGSHLEGMFGAKKPSGALGIATGDAFSPFQQGGLVGRHGYEGGGDVTPEEAADEAARAHQAGARALEMGLPPRGDGGIDQLRPSSIGAPRLVENTATPDPYREAPRPPAPGLASAAVAADAIRAPTAKPVVAGGPGTDRDYRWYEPRAGEREPPRGDGSSRDTTPSSRAAETKAPRDFWDRTSDWLGNHEALILGGLGGLGAMAAAPTRNLGTALAIGLGGGAKAYSAAKTGIAGQEKTQADAFRYNPLAPSQTARAPNGDLQTVTNDKYHEILEGLHPGWKVGGGNSAASTPIPVISSSAPGRSATAPFSDAVLEEIREIRSMPPGARPEEVAKANAAALKERDVMLGTRNTELQLVLAIMDSPTGGPATQKVLLPLSQWINDVARHAGVGKGDFFFDPNAAAASETALKQQASLATQIFQQTGQYRALGALNAIMSTFPGIGNTPAGGRDVASALLTKGQEVIDYGNRVADNIARVERAIGIPGAARYVGRNYRREFDATDGTKYPEDARIFRELWDRKTSDEDGSPSVLQYLIRNREALSAPKDEAEKAWRAKTLGWLTKLPGVGPRGVDFARRYLQAGS